MWILIPAYQPDHRLIELVGSLHRELPGAQVVVIDDGSGPEWARVFDTAARHGARVLTHGVNRGKAEALRTGLAWAWRSGDGQPIVCADSDGQHRPADIAAVAAELASRSEGRLMVLGTRAFDGDVPARSRFGNRATTTLVALTVGRTFRDTQTGLRGYTADLVPWLMAIPGERFAWELRVLLEAARTDSIEVVEVEIETVYLDHNASSHFRPLIDSVHVMAPLALFAASSLLAVGVDLLGVLGLHALTGNLALSVVGARLVSASVNFTVNRRFVFGAKGAVLPHLVRYGALAGVLLAGSYLGVAGLTHVGLPLVVAKLGTDFLLWVASFALQRTVVFAPRTATRKSDSAVNGRRSQVANRTSTSSPAEATSAQKASVG